MSLLQLEELNAGYGQGRVLHGVSFELGENDTAGILGANGAGKTTTLRAISGMVRTSGRIRFDGKEITGMAPDRISRLGIAHVPEGRGTFGDLSVRDNLRVGAYQRRNRRQIAQDMDMCLDLFPNLHQRIASNASALSGGEQQMLAIARAFMARPRIILLDEASLGLAPSTARRVYESIKRLQTESGVSLVVVEQNAPLAFLVVDHAVVLESGTVSIRGTRDELMRMDEVRRAYLGG
jgi:branched-chain amino acid transport system ATP-binding protein